MNDTCPRCLARDIPPSSERTDGDQIIHGYACQCGRRWGTARQIDAYPEGDQPVPDPCPTPGKHRYATRQAGLVAAERTEVPFGRRLNPYECRCGWWHLSKLADPERYRRTA